MALGAFSLGLLWSPFAEAASAGGMSGGMMGAGMACGWGMALFGLIVLVALILAILALVKYLRSDGS